MTYGSDLLIGTFSPETSINWNPHEFILKFVIIFSQDYQEARKYVSEEDKQEESIENSKNLSFSLLVHKCVFSKVESQWVKYGREMRETDK